MVSLGFLRNDCTAAHFYRQTVLERKSSVAAFIIVIVVLLLIICLYKCWTREKSSKRPAGNVDEEGRNNARALSSRLPQEHVSTIEN